MLVSINDTLKKQVVLSPAYISFRTPEGFRDPWLIHKWYPA